MSALGSRLVWVAVLMAGCVLPVGISVEDDGLDSDTIRGSGHAVTVTRSVEDFHRIEVTGVGRVVLQRTERERLSITADDNLMTYIETEVRAGTLHIRPKRGVNLNPRAEMVFRVEAVALDRIEGSGAVGFEVDLQGQPELFVTLSGVCVLEARGAVERLEVLLSGVTGFRGLEFQSRRARVLASGVSWAEVLVAERLDADASGVSTIRYAGDPQEVIAHTSGLSSIGPY